LNKYTEKEDIINLILFLKNESEKRDVQIMATDKNGIVLARTKVMDQRGDNIWQTTAFGHALSLGEKIISIEKGKYLPLIMVATELIEEGEEIIGSLVVINSLNDDYIKKFKEQYLKEQYFDNNIQLASYTKEEGIIGSTFEKTETKNILDTYFGIGSDLVNKDLSNLEKEVKIEGKYYFVKNIIFPGIEKSPGGLFIFCRSYHFFQGLTLSIIILLIFLLLEKIIHRSFFDHSVRRKKHIIFLIIGSLVIFLTVIIVSTYKLDKDAIKLEDTSYLIYNSVLKIVPEADIIDRSFEKRFTIKLLTGGEAINTVRAKLNYDSQKVRVLDIITTKSFCKDNLFIKKDIDNENGVVDIICGLPSPGFVEPIGIVAELLVQSLQSGRFTLCFDEETQVLANDGLGTDVLRLALGGSYCAVEYDNSGEIIDSIPVFSYTHPNKQRWYKEKYGNMSWSINNNATGYKYDINQVPDFIPGEENITEDNSFDFNVDDDGIYYFHLTPMIENATSSTSHFRIMIDSTPPLSPVILASSENVKKGGLVRFYFTGEDELSGVQNSFYIKINEGMFFPVKPPLYIPFLEKGESVITIMVFDKANNFSESKIKINVWKE